MVTLIRTLKRITTKQTQRNESSKTKTAQLAQTAQNVLASHVLHDSQLKTKEAATDADKINEQSSHAQSEKPTTSPQKASATADTSHVKSAAANSDENYTQSDRKRKSSSTDEVVAPKKVAARKKKRYIYICSADGCTNRVVSGGVCTRHGAKKKLCSTEGCTNQVKQGGVCWRHGAKKICAAGKDAQPMLSKEECASSMEQNGQTRSATEMGVRTMPRKEECASSTGLRGHEN
uniref:WRKY19-like zinc finger domain-containing protein n=1 Tax=Skeletonema marinoi TaxID=267567 RepID=A0A7S2M596_9STRA